MRRRHLTGLIGVLAGILIALVAPFPEALAGARPMAAIAVIMAVWWVFEVVPIAVTSLLPLLLFPLLGVADMKATSAQYGKPAVFLFLGGFILALAIERCGLHRRVALGIVRLIGSRPKHLILGFMLATATLSMWISNTASVMAMLPIALAVLAEAKHGPKPEHVMKLGAAIMLGIAYAADMGGMATLVGTPPNAAYVDITATTFPDAPRVAFADWFLMGFPLAVVFVGLGWLMLTRFLFRLDDAPVFGERDVIRESMAALGPMTRDEVITGFVFGVTALLWMTRAGFGDGIGGWGDVEGLELVGDAAVAIAAAVVLFLVPSRSRPGEALMDWETARRLPWGILLLFGGGFALSHGFKVSGLSDAIGQLMVGLADLPTWLLVTIVCLILTFMTELTSNTATTNLVLPILAKAGQHMGLDPRLLMVPATLSASCAFMMPVASPTQAIVFGSGYLTIRQMVKAGIWFNLLGVVLVTVIFFLIGTSALGIDPAVMPDWAAAVAPAP